MRLPIPLLVIFASLQIVFTAGQVTSGVSTKSPATSGCYSEASIPQGHYDYLLKSRKIPSTHPEACFMGCIYRKLGLTKNGGLDVPFAKAVAHKFYGLQPQKLTKALAIVDTCGILVRNINDECTLGLKTRECLIIKSDSSFAPIESEITAVL